MPKVFVTADTHYGHKNIIEWCNRPFSSVEQMDETLIANHNAVVGPEDHVYHVGDFAWKQHVEYQSRLNGKIHLISGNHDKFSAGARDGFEEVLDLFYGFCPQAQEVGRLFLFHYPLVTWPRKASAQCLHLYGHVHGRYFRPGEYSYDVGVDCNEYRPKLLTEFVELAKRKYNERTVQVNQVPERLPSNPPDPSRSTGDGSTGAETRLAVKC